MSDICEKCGCPEGVDGHDVLYRQIDDLKKVANVCEAIGTMDADERSTLCDRIKELEEQRDALISACKLALEATGGSKYWNGQTAEFLHAMEVALSKVAE